MANERKTEAIVRERLTRNGYYSDITINVEEQTSENPKIKKLLKRASKSGGGAGHPEFIISATEYPDFLIIIECKADPTKHESKTRDRYAEYAVDGVLLYSSHLSKEYDVLAIAVSGQTAKELRISHWLYLRGANKPEEFSGGRILRFSDYYNQYIKDERKFKQEYHKLLDYSKELNEILHAKKIVESKRSLLISGILIALKSRAFVAGYKNHKTAAQLAKSLTNTIIGELTNSDIPKEGMSSLQQAFSFLETHATISTDKEFVQDLIEQVDVHINSFVRTYQYFDTIGQFYIEFLRYANNDKGLGIVLTPPHITDLFARLAMVNKDSVVLDNCCGTGGFLISAMKQMVLDAEGDTKKLKAIKKKQLLGIEYQDDIYALAVSNMVLHDDGKSNVYQKDCFTFDRKIINKIKPNVGLLNPPYKTKKSDTEELEFVLNNIDMLSRGGTCVAIVPINSVLVQKGKGRELKRRILSKHTLEAVMSMPGELFHNSKIGVVTASIVITAHIPHPSNKETWFGYWRDDGFVKTKHRGRIDLNSTWGIIRDRWVDMFLNRAVNAGESLMKKVSAEEEWCVEAYMETDYSTITRKDFEDEVKKYVVHNILSSPGSDEGDKHEAS
jgi:type I restriction enzyme M protein